MTRRCTAALLCGVLMGTFVLVPLMDRPNPDTEVAFETGHAEGICTAGHDHALCIQVAKNLGADATPPARDVALAAALGTPRPGSSLAFKPGDSRGPYRTRAPPTT